MRIPFATSRVPCSFLLFESWLQFLDMSGHPLHPLLSLFLYCYALFRLYCYALSLLLWEKVTSTIRYPFCCDFRRRNELNPHCAGRFTFQVSGNILSCRQHVYNITTFTHHVFTKCDPQPPPLLRRRGKVLLRDRACKETKQWTAATMTTIHKQKISDLLPPLMHPRGMRS